MNFNKIMVAAFAILQEIVSSLRMAFINGDVRAGATDLICARKAAFGIMFEQPERTLEQSFLMAKGNIAEDMFAKNLETMGLVYETQGDYHGEGDKSFIQVHPDFLIDVNNPGEPTGEAKEMIAYAKKNKFKYVLIELKTSNAVPLEPHGYWVQQVNMQVDYISKAKKIKQEEICAFVYVIELDYGRHDYYEIEFDPEDVLIAEYNAISFYDVITEYIQFANGDIEIEDMQYTIYNVEPTFGTICNMCEWADLCTKEKDSIELPAELAEYAKEVKEWKDKEKNTKAKNTEIKEFMQKHNVKKSTSDGMVATIRGGNTKDIVDIDSMSDDEKDELWKTNMRIFNLNDTLYSKLEPKRYKEMMKKYPGTKTTAESLILKRTK